ncbi:restriction endonuclease subunit S [Vibrio parahaemolyticus]|nr:restriction endonuclease subunit S [Vibrio parahaemolyticus]MDF4637203.1 restriction endonuclease subunit S [Vibrio parahaemolyticus]MDF5483727.1 restriction endonuclease subunit S [Vibrio parahaemolyticus]MDG2622233.1 restriction endonuclease subunit S [Vibrio parahaemolyticus]MDG2839290.1 restriction endonuclease subunit S [Vibrio parahaemolyticus]
MSDTMIKQMPKYESYKESGEQWIDKVPSHWEIVKLKHLFYEKKHRQNMSLSCGAISFGHVIQKDDSKTPLSTKVSYQEVLRGEFLINPLNLNYDLKSLRIGLSYIDVVVSAGYIVLKERSEIDKEYFKFLLHRYDVAYMKLLGSGVRQTINFNHIANSLLALPPLEEQKWISSFLNKKTAQIDEAMAIKQKQIELLKERKQIIIQQAVTQGLNPDVPMKDSDVDWIGTIPEHWNVKRLKYVLEERNERSKTGEEPLFMVSQVHGLVVRADYHEKAEVAASNIDSKIVYKNDLVFNKLKAHLGVFFKSNIDFKGLVSPDYAVYKSKAYISDMKILELLFRHPSYIEQFVIRATGIVEGLIRLYTNELFDIAVPIAPENEQREIISFVESESLKYDQAIAIQVQQIEKLKEYKTTLINSAVTGKINVTELA